ncbi:FAD-dependent oxidoreductase [Clostridium estertheticum]|uniref:dihydrolipoyl dehydrogenase family protein n=1 Tax=Clostridium estertheticum TaxID=238834 RepID=UPI0013E94566|nr:FAD-dependent oxidoreductase [Clostridium estertheticum]MBZ9689127.1 FAD-dependent oxidoreductase [Clostridium estertheticum]
MKYDYHIIIIGAGSAGLVVASGAATLGARVALIEGEKMGGDCLNAGCVPSKAFLKCAHLAKDIRESQKYGLDSIINEVNLEDIMKRVKSVIEEIEPHDSRERFESLGVEVIIGRGEVLDGHTVKIGERIITSKSIVIATGSEPVIPKIKGLEDISYLTNRNIFDLKKLPKHLIILGGGPIGLELGQGFRHLGSKVTVIDMSDSLFGKDDAEVGPIMEKVFIDDGVILKLNAKIVEIKKNNENITVVIEKGGKIEEITGDNLLVSLGRKPVTQGLGLQKAKVELNERGFVVVNKKLQTSIKNIYACGDAAGPYQFTHMAGYQAGIVVRNIIFHLGSKVDYSVVPWTTYTKPEVAHVGYTEPMAKKIGVFKEAIIVPLDEIDRAKTENDRIGFLKLILGEKGKIIGATLVGEKAGETIPLATLAIKKKLKATAYLSMIFSYPTEAEIFSFASLKILKKSFKAWQNKLVKLIFLR